MRSEIPKRFTGTVIEFFLCLFDVHLSNSSERGLFRKVLTNQSIRIFVDATLPRGIRMTKIEIRCELLRDLFVFRKFSPVVAGDGLDDQVLQLGADRASVSGSRFCAQFSSSEGLLICARPWSRCFVDDLCQSPNLLPKRRAASFHSRGQDARQC